MVALFSLLCHFVAIFHIFRLCNPYDHPDKRRHSDAASRGGKSPYRAIWGKGGEFWRELGAYHYGSVPPDHPNNAVNEISTSKTMMTFKNHRKYRLAVTLTTLLGCLSAVSAAPARIASQSDLGKMWRTGGLTTTAAVPVSGQPFKTAVSFTSPKKAAHSWDAQGGTNPKSALHQGDALVATFFVRSAKPASGLVTFSVEGGPKYDRLAWQDLKISNQWKKVSVPFKSKGTYAPGKWQLTFKMGSLAQTVQIANFQLVNSGS